MSKKYTFYASITINGLSVPVLADMDTFCGSILYESPTFAPN